MKPKRSRVGDMRTVKNLLERADSLALAAGEQKPGAEHLVMAAIDLDDGTARRAFQRAGGDPDDFASAVEQVHVEALHNVGVGAAKVSIDASPRRRRGIHTPKGSLTTLLKDASKLAKAERSSFLGAHLLLAAAGLEYGTTARAISSMGVDRAALAAAARVEIDAVDS